MRVSVGNTAKHLAHHAEQRQRARIADAVIDALASLRVRNTPLSRKIAMCWEILLCEVPTLPCTLTSRSPSTHRILSRNGCDMAFIARGLLYMLLLVDPEPAHSGFCCHFSPR
jgi:hypothetical protein